MAQEIYITQMTFYAYTIKIYYQSYPGGQFGFGYRMKEGDEIVHFSLPVYKTAIEAGRAALDEIQERDNAEVEARKKNIDAGTKSKLDHLKDD